VEAHLGAGLPAFTLVGLPDTSLHEARDRVRAAIASSGLEWPNRRLPVNLTPASLPKSGAETDLDVDVAALAASGQVEARAAGDRVHIGELGLDGRVRPVRGILPAVMAAASHGALRCVVPAGNLDEARLVPDVEVTGVATLAELARQYGSDTA